MKNAYHQPYGPSSNFKKWLWILLFILFIIVMVIPSIIVSIGGAGITHLFGFIPASNQYQDPAAMLKNQNQSGGPPLEIGWVSGSGSAVQHLSDYKNLKIASPETAYIDDQYNLQLADPALAGTIRGQGKKLWARITMKTDSKPNVHSFLTSPIQTQNVIEQLVQSARSNHWDGINLDIENVNIQDRDVFSAFVKKLSSALNKSSICLSIDLPPDSGGDNSKSPFDHVALGKYCNYVFFMGYDEHWSTDPAPGPITSLSWLKENVQEFIQTGIPSEKLILGLPAYTRVWEENQQNQIVRNPAEPIPYIENLVAQDKRKLVWEATLGEYYTTYSVNSLQYQIWLPTSKSFNLYLKLIPEFHLAGSAVWNLDFMNSAYWNQIF